MAAASEPAGADELLGRGTGTMPGDQPAAPVAGGLPGRWPAPYMYAAPHICCQYMAMDICCCIDTCHRLVKSMSGTPCTAPSVSVLGCPLNAATGIGWFIVGMAGTLGMVGIPGRDGMPGRDGIGGTPGKEGGIPGMGGMPGMGGIPGMGAIPGMGSMPGMDGMPHGTGATVGVGYDMLCGGRCGCGGGSISPAVGDRTSKCSSIGMLTAQFSSCDVPEPCWGEAAAASSPNNTFMLSATAPSATIPDRIAAPRSQAVRRHAARRNGRRLLLLLPLPPTWLLLPLPLLLLLLHVARVA
mmetsp:Transcript_24060/g.71419  ORF Transcript_24060/g.71419 Transcript_24060/m.71419 type:complete len:298 (-) Transcript_24060:76-969(-)